jgi:hypothetical protein
LIDHGANGGVFRLDVKILEYSQQKITLTGLDNHQVKNLPICTGAAYAITHCGPVILIMHQYAFIGHGKTIHASGQLEIFGIIVDECSKIVTKGKQQWIFFNFIGCQWSSIYAYPCSYR